MFGDDVEMTVWLGLAVFQRSAAQALKRVASAISSRVNVLVESNSLRAIRMKRRAEIPDSHSVRPNR